MFLSVLATGQKSRNYKHIYKFQLDTPKDTSYVQIDTFAKSNSMITIEGQVVDNNMGTLANHTVLFMRLDTPSKTAVMTDYKGQFNIYLEKGMYDLVISGVGYETFNIPINITGQPFFSLKIVQARQQSWERYNIRSAKKMSRKEIYRVKQCVQQSPDRPGNCGKKNQFFVTMEI